MDLCTLSHVFQIIEAKDDARCNFKTMQTVASMLLVTIRQVRNLCS